MPFDPKNVSYEMIKSKAALRRALRRLGDSPACALDFETTSFTADTGRVRLVSLSNDRGNYLVDFDAIKGGFKAVADLFDVESTWIVFNTGFEMRWFQAAGVEPNILDVQHMRRAVLGGSRLNLKTMVQWDLGYEMSKEQQASDWAKKDLSEEQLDYAMLDAVLTWELYMYWGGKMNGGQWDCARLLAGLDLPVIEMEEAGMLLDQQRHAELTAGWVKKQDAAVERLREYVDETEVNNINSGAQWSDYLSAILDEKALRAWPKTEKTGQLQTSTEVLRSVAAANHGNAMQEAMDALADYKTLSKYVSSFGETLITKAKMDKDGRIHARFNIGAAKTLRFSSSSPNLQQIPRDKDDFFGELMSIRSSFIAPKGRRLVSLDYSGIELRVLALLTNDKQLLQDVVEGDVHLEVGSRMAGRRLDKSVPADKAIRTSAKAVSFGIIYGSGAGGLSVTLRTSENEAQGYIDFWANRYPRAFQLRHKMMDEALKTQYITMIDGGTIYMGKRPELPKCANYPVQRAAWTIMARAIIRFYDRLQYLRTKRGYGTTKLLSTIHDALIAETSSRLAPTILGEMEKAMEFGYLDVFPGAPTGNLLEGGVGQNWGDL